MKMGIWTISASEQKKWSRSARLVAIHFSLLLPLDTATHVAERPVFGESVSAQTSYRLCVNYRRACACACVCASVRECVRVFNAAGLLSDH